VEEIFDKTYERIAQLVNKTWFSKYPRCCHIIYDNGSKLKLNFEYLCVTYGAKHKPTTVKNPQATAILEHLHQVLAQMLHTSELDMAETITPDDANVFLDKAAWVIHSTYHTVLKASPGVVIIWRDVLLDIPFIADWNKIGDYRQRQTNLNMARANSKRVDYDYEIGNNVLLTQEGILCKAESPYSKDP
jgi:hypothetical protein